MSAHGELVEPCALRGCFPLRTPRTLSLILLCALGGSTRSVLAAVSDYLGKPIGSVRLALEGRDSTDPALVQVVETAVGQPLSMVQVRESVAHLFSLGRFEDVRVDATLDNGRVTLRYELSPIHPVTSIQFSGGAPGIDDDALRRALTDRYGATPPVGRTADMVRILADVLRERGYLHPNIAPRVQLEHAPERATLSFAIDPGIRTTIGTVDVVGRPTVSRDEFLQRLGVAIGAPYQPEPLNTRIARYIDERRRGGYYEAKVVPSVRFDEDARVAFLTLTIDPGPHVRVVFAGDSLPSNKRDELVPVEREGSVDEDLLEDSSNRIEEYFKGFGYRDATAPHTREQINGELVITFTVKKGAQYRVSAYEISGNASIPLAEFAASLRLREGQPFSETRLAADVSTLDDVYHRRGFASARARAAPEPRPTANPSADVPVRVRMVIVEGVRTVVDSVTLLGTQAVSESVLRGKVGLQPGAPFVPGQLTVDRDAIQAAYDALGYESATVQPRTDFSQDGTHVAVRFEIQEGPQVFVDHVLIVGNVRTRSDTIERHLEVQSGDPFSLSKINDTQRRLSALGLFRRVRVTELRHGGETKRDLLVTVEEAAPTTIGYGLGAEARFQVVRRDEEGGVAAERLDVAPRTFFEYGRRNLFGKNRSINVFTSVSVHLQSDVSPGARPTEYRVLSTYREPRLFDTTADGLLTATIERQIRSSFTFRRDSVSAQVARRLTRTVSVTGAYQLQRTELLAVKVDPAQQLQINPLISRLFSTEPLRLSALSASVIRDTRDDAVNPTSGQYFTANGQVDAMGIGSQVGFAKSFFRAQTFRTLAGSNGVVLAGNASLGIAAEFSTDRPIPEPERFFAGGDTTDRGFALDTLGVRHAVFDPQTDTIDQDGFPIGGNATVILNGELRVPIRGGLGVVGFFDSGNVFQRVSQVDLTELRSAVGFGVRYKSPFGPLRVDLGFKTHIATFTCPTTADPAHQCVESRPALHISFGQAF